MIRSFFLTVFAALYIFFTMIGGSLIAGTVSIFAKNKMRVFGNVSRVWARSVLFVCGIKIEVKGMENLSLDGPTVLVANHQGNFDIPVMVSALPFNFRFMVKQELFRIPMFGWYMKNRGDVSIDRGSPRNAIIALKKISEMVKKGEPVLIFPEGTRSMDGSVGEFKRGSMIVAMNANARIVPIAISGSINIQKRGTLMVNPSVVHVNIGEGIDLKGKGDTTGKEAELLAEIRQKVISLMVDF